MATDVIYFDSLTGKKSKYGIRISGKVEDIINELQKHENNKGYINLEIKERRTEGKYGQTHYVVVDKWEPSNSRSQSNDDQHSQSRDQSSTSSQAPATTSAADDDLPF